MVAEVIDNTTSRGRTLRFLYDGPHDEFKQALYSLGMTPLPPYIKRTPEPCDIEDYQCIFAEKEGAVVAPAAGLHFSRSLITRLKNQGRKRGFCDYSQRPWRIPRNRRGRLDKAPHGLRANGCRPAIGRYRQCGKGCRASVCAVGTSVLRAIATADSMGGHMKTYTGWTNKFIFPPYDFSVASSLVTNFHMPYSTMLMMVAAFGGYELVMKAYNEAVKEGYRFGCYGDAMLIL